VSEGIVFYTRRGCRLCEELLARLREGGLDPDRWPKRDVDRDPEARALFSTRLPVLTLDGRVVHEGRPDEASLARLLALLHAPERAPGGGPAR
jgi:hypothetical protein